jgi:hypothetical protein
VGVDFSELAIARAQAADPQGSVLWVRADILTLPDKERGLPEEAFDLVGWPEGE